AKRLQMQAECTRQPSDDRPQGWSAPAAGASSGSMAQLHDFCAGSQLTPRADEIIRWTLEQANLRDDFSHSSAARAFPGLSAEIDPEVRDLPGLQHAAERMLIEVQSARLDDAQAE